MKIALSLFNLFQSNQEIKPNANIHSVRKCRNEFIFEIKKHLSFFMFDFDLYSSKFLRYSLLFQSL
ncbi:hypothetical protein SAMN00777080_4281 [Aquiflexum balticum DSM 16537]|uniref:Uncharacterized protein n=1 Tax=Aquiflexum balticum DSM 16537 TaxID=758820 RepID=A0A1W2H9Q7_9BACT|nr:hypothetical protein SAMN00777080_4281 [Aquiflexum balticum DSM 16537]